MGTAFKNAPNPKFARKFVPAIIFEGFHSWGLAKLGFARVRNLGFPDLVGFPAWEGGDTVGKPAKLLFSRPTAGLIGEFPGKPGNSHWKLSNICQKTVEN